MSSEDTQQFSAQEIAQLKKYAKRSTPVPQPKTPTATNRVHLAIVVVVGVVAIAILALMAWGLYLTYKEGQPSANQIVSMRQAPIVSTHQSDAAFEGVGVDGTLLIDNITSRK